MRTLRLSLAGTAILMLLGGAGGAAQSDEATPDQAFATWVQGTQRLITNIDFGEKTMPDEGSVLEEVRGRVLEGVIEASDPRVSGSTTVTVDYVAHLLDPDGGHANAMWGTERIENDGGAWECSWSGGDMTRSLSQYLSWCVGMDGYEGWAMRRLATATDILGIDDFVGVLWPGDLPPLPEPPAAE